MDNEAKVRLREVFGEDELFCRDVAYLAGRLRCLGSDIAFGEQEQIAHVKKPYVIVADDPYAENDISWEDEYKPAENEVSLESLFSFSRLIISFGLFDSAARQKRVDRVKNIAGKLLCNGFKFIPVERAVSRWIVSETMKYGDSFYNMDFSGVNLCNFDFSSYMQKCNFRGADLTKTNFKECDLGHCTFNSAIIDHTAFEKCSLVGANFMDCVMESPVFEYTDLTGVDFTGSFIKRDVFKKCDISNVRFDCFDFGEGQRLTIENRSEVLEFGEAAAV